MSQNRPRQTRRPASRLPRAIDFGPSPPSGVPASIFPLSAERSTLQDGEAPGRHLKNASEALLTQGSLRMQAYPTFPPSQAPGPFPRFATKVNPAGQPPQQHEGPEDDDMDVDDGDDSVYYINSGPNSYSCQFPSQEDPVAPSTASRDEHPPSEHSLDHGDHPQDSRSSANAVPNTSLYTSGHSVQLWQQDLHLRNLIRQLKARLIWGARLTIERLVDGDPETYCVFPFCTSDQHRISTRSLYITLGLPVQQSTASYCLLCFEELWNGVGVIGPLPAASVVNQQDTDDDVSVLGLDGSMDRQKEPCWVSVNGSDSSVTSPTISEGRSSSIWDSSISGEYSTPDTQFSCISEPSSPSQAKAARLNVQSYIPSPLSPVASVSPALPISPLLPESPRIQPWSRAEGPEHFADSQSSSRSEHQSQIRKDILSTQASRKLDSWADDLGKEAKMASKRLETMYKERERAIASLEPGEQTSIQNPRAGTTRGVKHTVRMDVLGSVYTDLLAEPSGGRRKSQVTLANSCARRQSRQLTARRSSRIIRAAPASTISWCTCSGSYKGERLVACSNERCLIGWYHQACVEENVNGEDCWFCDLCRSATQPRTGVMPFSSISPHEIETLVAPPYTRSCDSTNQQERCRPHPLAQFSIEKESPWEPTCLPQLDGPGDGPEPSSRAVSKARSEPEQAASVDRADSGDEMDLDVSKQLPAQKTPPQRPGSAFRAPESVSEWPTPGGIFSPDWPHGLPEGEQPHTRPQTPFDPANFPTPRGILSPSIAPREATPIATDLQAPRAATRMHHLAPFITAGSSLSETEKAAIALWKLASEEQIRLEMNRQWHSRLLRHYEKQDHDGNAMEHEEELPAPPGARAGLLSPTERTALKESESQLEALTGLEKEDLLGRDLSDILAAIVPSRTA